MDASVLRVGRQEQVGSTESGLVDLKAHRQWARHDDILHAPTQEFFAEFLPHGGQRDCIKRHREISGGLRGKYNTLRRLEHDGARRGDAAGAALAWARGGWSAALR